MSNNGYCGIEINELVKTGYVSLFEIKERVKNDDA